MLQPFYYEAYFSEDDNTPEYRGIVLATDEYEAERKVLDWYSSTHNGRSPELVTIGPTIT